MSRVQHKIWQIIWDLWIHRNVLLHGDGGSIHTHEEHDIDTQITRKWVIGLYNLPSTTYGTLFKGTHDQRISDKSIHKQKWLTSVWAARDIYPHQNTYE